ncbi:hypothetical protein AX14_009507 [Amanita brunnescens Koide BX004]|nr:hypothetical protein AX14_009507 [Amanita brunnescens Koide BX004]
MASFSGPPPGLTRTKSSEKPPPPLSSPLLPPSLTSLVSPIPRCPASAAWASSLAAGLFPSASVLPVFPRVTQPTSEAVQSAECLPKVPLLDNTLITDLAVLPAPPPSDPWHIAHSRICVHASASCAACSVSFICCSCHALRFTPGPPPALLAPTPLQRSRSVSPALFRNAGNGSPPPGFDDDKGPVYDDDAYVKALAECDTCDNSSCPRGDNEPATWTIIVEQFDEGLEEVYERTFRACAACNRACRRSFLGHKIKARTFDNSVKDAAKATKTDTGAAAISSSRNPAPGSAAYAHQHPANVTASRHASSVPGSIAYAQEHPVNTCVPLPARRSSPIPSSTDKTAPVPPLSPGGSLPSVARLQDTLLTLSARPTTPAAFVATIRVKHDALCSHCVSSCPSCSCGLVCCDCKRLFAPAVARHLACTNCKHIAFIAS